MKKFSILVVVTAVVCTFALFGLAACGGSGSSGGSSAGGTQEKSEPVPTDEELVKADLDKTFGALFSKDSITAMLQDDENIKNLESMGVSFDEFSDSIAKLFKYDVTSVEVDGDAAVAKVKLTIPTFNEETDKVMDKALADVTKGKDPSTMDKSEQLKLISDVIKAAFSDPDFPTTSSEFDVKYVKNGDTWQPEDKNEIESILKNAGSVAPESSK